jgi:hypothetical protein
MGVEWHPDSDINWYAGTNVGYAVRGRTIETFRHTVVRGGIGKGTSFEKRRYRKGDLFRKKIWSQHMPATSDFVGSGRLYNSFTTALQLLCIPDTSDFRRGGEGNSDAYIAWSLARCWMIHDLYIHVISWTHTQTHSIEIEHLKNHKSKIMDTNTGAQTWTQTRRNPHACRYKYSR